MTSWIMLACACSIAFMGLLTLNGRHKAQYRHPQKAGWGLILFSLGLTLDGASSLVGWSAEAGGSLAGVAMLLGGSGAVLQLLGGPIPRAARLLTSMADTNKPEPRRAVANVNGSPAMGDQGAATSDDGPRLT